MVASVSIMSASFLSLRADAAVEKKQDHSDVLDSSYGEVTAVSGQTAPMCVCVCVDSKVAYAALLKL